MGEGMSKNSFCTSAGASGHGSNVAYEVTSCDFKLVSWAAIACEDDDKKIEMKETYQEIFQNGGNGIPKGSLVDVDIGGEDAHFVDDVTGFIGVADGVGDKRLRGHSGMYSRFLMFNAKAIAGRSGSSEASDPFKLLMDARDASKVQGLSGKTTALLLRLLPSDDKTLPEKGIERTRMLGANVGDTCAILLRPGVGVIAETPCQKKGQTPYQLPEHPKDLSSRAEHEFEWLVQEGDVVVAGSDGLFDNVFREEIDEIVQQLIKETTSPGEFSKRAAEDLQNFARRKTFNETAPPDEEAHQMLNLEKPFNTPHITNAFRDLVQRGRVQKDMSLSQAKELGCWGGKSDDITVVVSRVILASSQLDLMASGLTRFERGKILQ